MVDPGSTDGSREWLESLDDKRVRLVFKKDSGPAEGLNNGLNACQSEIFIYLNADDELAPSALQATYDIHTRNPTADVVIGNGWTFDEHGRPIKFIRSDRFSPHRYAFSVSSVLQQATSFKWRLFDSGLRFDESNRYTWDTKLLYEASRLRARFLYVNDTLGYFRLHSESITASGRYEENLKISRDLLISSSVGPSWQTLGAIGSLPARSIKYLINSVWKLWNRPKFPGLVCSIEERSQ